MLKGFAGSRIEERASSAGTGQRAVLAAALALWPAIAAAQAGTITTVAGNGELGSLGDGFQATQANLGGPQGLAVGPFGDLFIADTANSQIRKVGTSGIITTFSGTGLAAISGTAGCARSLRPASSPPWPVQGFGGSSGDGGAATDASFDTPLRLAIDADGILYISDATSHRVRRVFAGGFTQTFAGTGVADFTGDGGAATQAQLNFPAALAFDPAGNLFVADLQNRRVRKIALVGPPALSADTTSVAVGGQLTFRVGGAQGQRVVIAYSRASSGAGSVQGQTLLLGSDLQLLTTGTVDSTGTFSLRATVSPGTPTGTFYLQAGVADDAALTTNLRLTNGLAITIRAQAQREDIIYLNDPVMAAWPEAQQRAHCQGLGGTFNPCGSACLDPYEVCIAVCAPRCEFGGTR